MTVTFKVLICLLLVRCHASVCPTPRVHPDVRGYGPECNYRCNCKNNDQCDKVSGECPNGCRQGWMGPACQYRNIATNVNSGMLQPNQTDNTYMARNAADLDEETCSKTGSGQGQRWLRLCLDAKFYLVGFILKVPKDQLDRFRGFSVEVSNTTDRWSHCYKDSNSYGSVVMEIICTEPLVGLCIRISLADEETRELIVCEAEIYGGRLVSFNKEASMDSMYVLDGPWNASYSVDGRVHAQGENQAFQIERTCASTDVDYNALRYRWWMLDLGSIYSIQGISFFGRDDAGLTWQFKGFNIDGSEDGTGYFELFRDSKISDIVSLYQPMSSNFTWPNIARVIKVYRNSVYILVFCELEIFAECPFGLCGWECNEACMCSSQTTGTRKILGTCPHGCASGWMGENQQCNRPCPPNTYGSNCQFNCGNCTGGASCNRHTGHCEVGCEPGYVAPLCKNACESDMYGENCTHKCGFCFNSTTCNLVNGSCHQGCAAGYTGPVCKDFCQNGRYGRNCASTCRTCNLVNTNSCDRETGECFSGCLPGWLGNFCNESCQEGFYGQSCYLNCGNCKSGDPCDPQTGHCQLCEAGYTGEFCTAICADDRYGQGCVHSCGRCAGGKTCNRTTGACPLGCIPPFTGSLCKEDSSLPSNNSCMPSTGLIITIVLCTLAVIIATVINVIVFYKRRSLKRKDRDVPTNSTVCATRSENDTYEIIMNQTSPTDGYLNLCLEECSSEK